VGFLHLNPGATAEIAPAFCKEIETGRPNRLNGASSPMKAIRTISVLGLGTMGHGIVQVFAAAGFQVRGFDEQKAARDASPKLIQRNLQDFVAAGLMRKSEVAPLLKRIEVCDSEADAVRGAQFVTEAVIEDLAMKQQIFRRLEEYVAADTILASNSSCFPISQSAKKMRRPERAIVTHYFNPPHIVPVVEVVPGPRTSPKVMKATLALMKKAGKVAVPINRELPGFIVNRVQVAVMREVWDLLDQGIATPEAIDAAICGSMGFRLAALGPLQVYDFGGLDLQKRVFENLVPEISSSLRVPGRIRRLVDDGHYGAKTGKGIYSYTPASLAARHTQRDQRFLALLKMFYADGSRRTKK
jgi:3-hydroxybutyryl-CoA dehydrogenase